MNLKLICVLALFITLAFHPVNSQTAPGEKQKIRQVITQCYIEPLYLDKDLAKIEDGFHPSFQMYVLYKGDFYLTPRDQWIQRIRETRARNLPKKQYDWKFDFIDNDKQTAVVKLIIHEDDTLKYVDYLTLYKFKEGWKVITKQFSIYQ